MSVKMASENDALRVVEAYLLNLCKENWRYIEFDDRLNELRLVFLYAWRQLPTNTGHFLADFERFCRPYMDELNRKACARFFKERSLEGAVFGKRNREGDCTFLHFLASNEDQTEWQVDDFLNSLTPRDQNILYALLNGESKGKIARAHGMSVHQLSCLLEAIGEQYLTRYSS